MTPSSDQPITCPILIGREPQLQAYTQYLQGAHHGHDKIVLLSGEAGVGKSRLIAELKRMAVLHEWTLLQGNCYESDRTLPYAPLRDMLQAFRDTRSATDAAAALRPFAAELIKLLPGISALFPNISATLMLEPELEKRRLFETLTQFVQQPAPTLIIIEDVHWSDDVSLQWLQFLARRTASQPILLLLTYRHDEAHDHPTLRHFLAELNRSRLAVEWMIDRLSRTDTERMMRAIFVQTRPIGAEFVDAVYELTDGNPFFVEEILKSLITAGDVYYTGYEWQRKTLHALRIPRSVGDAVQRRVQHISEAARQVLTRAAVAGRRFDFSLLPLLTGRAENDLLPLLKELIAAQLVVEESAEQFAFRHALTRQAIIAGLLAREQRALHEIVGNAKEQCYATPSQRDSHLADLAYHFYQAGDWSKALEYARSAGEQAQRLYAPRAALEQFGRAIEAAQRLGEAPDAFSQVLLHLYRARGQAYEMLGGWEQAHADYMHVLETAHKIDDQRAEWQSLIDLGGLWAGRNYQTMSEYFRQALALARQINDPAMLAQSLNRLGNWLANVGQPRRAQQHHEQALALLKTINNPQGLAQTLDLLGTAHYLAGDLIVGSRYYHQAIAAFRDQADLMGMASSLANLAMHASIDTVVTAGTLDEAARDGERAVQLSREIGWRANEALALCHVALCRSQQGNFVQALDAVQTALAIADDIEHRLWMIYARITLGAIYTALLDEAAARDTLEVALQMADTLGSSTWRTLAAAHLATAYISLHDFAQADVVLATALPPNQPIETLAHQWAETVRGELALARGDVAQALQIVDGLIARVPQPTGDRTAPKLARLRGEALAAQGRWIEAEAELHAAATEARTRGSQATVWYIHRALGLLYKQQRRRSDAKRGFAAACALVETLAKNIDDPVIRTRFLHRAHALLPDAPAPTLRKAAKQEWGGLTEREREVAVLIAGGKSNREIAAELIVGAKTVEAHISRILTKLGYTSRAQIAAWSVEKGLAQAPPDIRAEL